MEQWLFDVRQVLFGAFACIGRNQVVIGIEKIAQAGGWIGIFLVYVDFLFQRSTLDYYTLPRCLKLLTSPMIELKILPFSKA